MCEWQIQGDLDPADHQGAKPGGLSDTQLGGGQPWRRVTRKALRSSGGAEAALAHHPDPWETGQGTLSSGWSSCQHQQGAGAASESDRLGYSSGGEVLHLCECAFAHLCKMRIIVLMP